MKKLLGWVATLPARYCWGLFVLWVATIYWLSSQSLSDVPKPAFEIPHFDKLVHFLAFGGGGALASLALWRSGVSRQWAAVGAALMVTLYGAFDEWHQLSTPGRTGGDVFDWIADLAGAIVGAAFVYFYVSHASDPSRSCCPRCVPAPGTPEA